MVIVPISFVEDPLGRDQLPAFTLTRGISTASPAWLLPNRLSGTAAWPQAAGLPRGSDMDRKVALVAGAGGIIGRGIVEHLSGLDDWDVVGLARKAPDYESRARFVPVDLLDPEDCKAKLGDLGAVTDLFYTAYLEKPTEAERVEING